MRILIACEESQTVTKLARERGHEAYSCDIIPCSGGHPEWHLQQDVIPLLNDDWDMIIAFPPCTNLAVSGAAWFKQKIADGRQQQGIDFFMAIANADCPKIIIENPIGIMSTKWRKPDQIVQPWMWGDNASKKTCLWLKGVDKLVPDITKEPELEYHYVKGKKYMQKWMYDIRCKPVEERSRLASKTFKGVALAMVTQWLDEEEL